MPAPLADDAPQTAEVPQTAETPLPQQEEVEEEHDVLSEELGDTSRQSWREEEQRHRLHRPTAEDRRPYVNRDAQSRTPLIVGWMVVFILLAAVLAAAWFFRQQVVAAVPEIGRLYEFLGVELEGRPGDGLIVGQVSHAEEMEEGDPLLAVSGTVVNPTKVTLPIPVLTARVLASDGQEVTTWRFRAGILSLPPDGSHDFVTRRPYPNHKGPITVEVEMVRPGAQRPE